MGYIRNHTIVLSGWDDAAVRDAHAAARRIFSATGEEHGTLVSEVISHVINGGAAFFIAPDGSKEFWPDSRKGDLARTEFIEFLRTQSSLDWAEVVLGGDDGEYVVERSPTLPRKEGE